MITLILIRHGETTWNNRGKIQGSSDSSVLNKKGKLQAQFTAERLAKFKIDVMYASGLKRAKQTARIISKTVSIKIKVTKNLNERSFGILEGKKVDYVFGKLDSMPDKARYRFRPKNGESPHDVELRVRKEMKKIMNMHEGKTVLIITHGGVIKTVIKLIKKIPVEKRVEGRIKNTSLTMFKIHEEEVLEEIINDTKHLGKELL